MHNEQPATDESANNAPPRLCGRCRRVQRRGKHRWCQPCQREAQKLRRHAQLATTREAAGEIAAEIQGDVADAVAAASVIAGGSDATSRAETVGAAASPRRGPGRGRPARGPQVEVFGRPDDQIPRRDSKLVILAVLKDKGPVLYKQLCRGIDRSTAFAMQFIEIALDRQHGKAKQQIGVDHRFAGAVFQRDPGAPPALPDVVEAEPADLKEPAPPRADLAAALAVEVASIVGAPAAIATTQVLVVVPPPRFE